MIIHPTQKPAHAGVAVDYTPCDVENINRFVNTGKESVHVKNASEGSTIMTIAAQHACSFHVESSDHDLEITIPAGEDRRIGPINRALFNDANGIAHFSFSSMTDITVAVLA